MNSDWIDITAVEDDCFVFIHSDTGETRQVPFDPLNQISTKGEIK